MTNDAVKKPAKLLFLVWGGIGNMVMALPMIMAAIDSLAGTNFVILAQKRAMLELLGDDHRIERFSLDDSRFKGVSGKRDLVLAIRALKPDVVISTVPSPRFRSGLLAFFSGAGMRICLEKYGSIFFNVQVPVSKKHYVCQNLSLLAPLGILTDKFKYSISFPGKHEGISGKFFASVKIGDNEKIVGIHPGAGDPHKRWPADKFIELGKGLIAAGARPVVFGGPGEMLLVKEICDGIGREAVAFTGSEDLMATLAIIRQCDLFISNDSGLAHCAAALKIPTIVIFGPTDPEICAPISAYVRVIKNEAKCKPCYRPANRFDCAEYPLRCLDIPVKNVLEVYDKLMQVRHE